MTTRTYYFPKNRIGLYLINYIVSKISCSVGDPRVNVPADVIQVAITCNDKDVQKIERILSYYGMIGD